MSIQTQPRATADEIHAREVLARRRAMINQGAASIRVTVERDGKPVSVFLNTLPPVERIKAIQQLLSVPELPAHVPAPSPVPAIPPTAAPIEVTWPETPKKVTPKKKAAKRK